MSDGWALVEIKRLVAIGRVVYTLHARQRMIQRGASVRDVEHALLGAHRAIYQEDRGGWRVRGGVDLDGDELTVVADLQTDVLIITVF